MKFNQAFKLAFKSMWGSKVRTLLTMLGIIIGVAAVILLVSLMGGFSQRMTDAFSSMGTTTLSAMLRGRGIRSGLDPADVMRFAEENTDLFLYASPIVSIGNATVKYGANNMTLTVSGGSESYHMQNSYTIEYGRAISYPDMAHRSKTALIGTDVVEELFEGVDPVGADIRINGERFTVVGVLAERGETIMGGSNEIVIIPYTAAQRLVRNVIVTSYRFSAVSTDKVDEAKAVLERFLLEKTGSPDYYRVFSVAEMLDTFNELTGTLTMLLVGIAGISLLVGGIGIMNIMLVSVTERTKEIGIRKSLGGKRRDILLQFVIEAATTSAAGGVIGIGLGCAAAIAVARLVSLSAAVSPFAIAVAFSVSVGIGILFGYYPAAKASKLNPIDALRYE